MGIEKIIIAEKHTQYCGSEIVGAFSDFGRAIELVDFMFNSVKWDKYQVKNGRKELESKWRSATNYDEMFSIKEHIIVV